MNWVGKRLAILAATGLVAGQAYGQNGAVMVRDAPVHAAPSEAAEANAPPNTLNAQYAALSMASPAPQSRPAEGASAPIAARIVEAAGAFEAYMRKAGAIDGKFADGPSVSRAVSTGSAYEIQQLQEGTTAYVALAALQDPAFVRGVYDLGRDPREADALAVRLLAEPKAVLDIDGAEEAAAMTAGVLARMGAALVKAGQAVRQSAYDVQRQAWSKEAIPQANERLAAAKAQSAARSSLSPADTDALLQTVVALRKAGGEGPRRGAAPSPMVTRGLALAALAVLGRAGEEDAAKVAPLLGDAKSADCMKMAKLNLYQCMAVAGPHYEDVYCLGQHALMDTGQCVVSAAGYSPLPDGPQTSVAAARSISVPIALTPGAGPERQRAFGRDAQDEAPPPPQDFAVRQPPRRPSALAPAPREIARDDRGDDRYDDRFDDRDDRYADAPAARDPQDGYREERDDFDDRDDSYRYRR